MDLGLKDKVAFIAGSSRGIGFAIAGAFIREGAKVIITGRNLTALNEAAAALAAGSIPGRVLSIQADLTDPSEIEHAVEQSIAIFGRLEVVVANVGSGRAPSGWDVASDDWLSVLNLNLLSSMALARATLPHLISSGGSLTFISSIAGIESINAPVPYSAAKAAVISAMKNLSRSLGANRVRVNAVAPGNILFPGGSWERKLAERREFFDQYVKSEVPLQRFGTVEEVADVVAFLASEKASFITGSCVVVDGGQTRSA